MAIKIKSTAELEFIGVKCVVYGGAGVGKTRLCATAPRPIIISAEEGLLSLTDVNVDFVEIKSLQDLDDAYKQLKNHPDYDTICLDSLSEIAEVLVAELKPQFKDGRQAYMALADAMIPMLKRFRDIKGKNTVFTCKKIDVKDEESGVVTTELFLPGNVLGNQVPYIVDELFYMDVERTGVPFLQTKPNRKAFAKDRSGALAPKGEYAKDKDSVPDLSVLFEKIRAKKIKDKALLSI